MFVPQMDACLHATNRVPLLGKFLLVTSWGSVEQTAIATSPTASIAATAVSAPLVVNSANDSVPNVITCMG